MIDTTDLDCPFCGGAVSESDLFAGNHETGCGAELELYTDEETGETTIKT